MFNEIEKGTPSLETAVSAYKDQLDYLKDQWAWLDLSLALRLHIQQQLEEGLNLAPNAGLEDVKRALPADPQIEYDAERLIQLEKQIEGRLKRSEEEGVFLPLSYLSRTFGLTTIEEKVIIVCLAIEVDRKYESAYELLQQESGWIGRYPTVDLTATLISLSAEQRLQVIQSFDQKGTLRKYFLQKEGQAVRAGSRLSQAYKLDERIVRFILYSTQLDPSMDDYARLIRPSDPRSPLAGSMDIQNKLRQWIMNRLEQPDQMGAPLLISLCGKLGTGKKTQIIHLCHSFGEPLLLIDLDRALSEKTSLNEQLETLFREANLQQALLVIDNFQVLLATERKAYSGQIEKALDELSELSGIVFLLSEEPLLPVDRKRRIALELELPSLEDEERATVWQQLAQDYPVEASIDWEALSARFIFNPGQMINALNAARTIAEWNRLDGEGRLISWRDMIQASYKQLTHTLGTKSKRLSPKNSWNELILPEAQKEKLQHACNHIQYKHMVYGRWGFNKKLSYGTGISLLFSGPPGTGKTMASEIVAKELDMEIYKIDLSQIISKYIGETEKNLREIFDEAQASYAVLFFDEADALFGKRSEVKDSHDKNANTEVAFLLQKMEEYRGISILATNYLQNMDEAFLRRINYVIRFPFPDEKQRETIWQQIFPSQTPLEQDIDYGFLARKLQMAGGSIKNIALTSAFLASGNEERVGMKHIFKAYQYELDKTNRAITRDDLGEYAYLFDDFL